MNRETLLGMRQRALTGLTEVLDFFIDQDMDLHGGFYGAVSRELKPDPHADRSLVLHARILWTYAAAYRVLKIPRYLDAARHAFCYIREHFLDPVFGGGYWGVHADGMGADTDKYPYGNSFLIYGGAEMYRACGEEEALKMAIDVYELLEHFALDPQNDGYFECFDRRWNRLDKSFNIKDTSKGSKALNTHLHLIESYTNLMRVWDNPVLKTRVGSLIDIMTTKLLDTEIFHYKPYMTDTWGNVERLISYGHDIEGAWLLTEACEAYGNIALLDACKPISVRIADSCHLGVDPATGGMWAEKHPDGTLDRAMTWWVQAEAVVGFFNAWQLTGEEKYLRYTEEVWGYIDRCIIDREGGVYREWKSDGREGQTRMNANVVNPWKTPYHNGRMYLELIERIDRLLESGEA